MTTESHITQEARDFVGKRGEVRTALVTEQAIRRFSVAIGDKNPLWRDRKSTRLNSSH